MHKTRPAHDQVQMTEVTGRVRDRIAIVGDDVTTTGGTQIHGAKALREHGATGVVIADTVPIDPVRMPHNVTVLTVSRLLADTIMNVFSDDSVSAIFGG